MLLGPQRKIATKDHFGHFPHDLRNGNLQSSNPGVKHYVKSTDLRLSSSGTDPWIRALNPGHISSENVSPFVRLGEGTMERRRT